MSNDEIVAEFLVESVESLDKLDQHLVSLESNPDDKDTINLIFRLVHTIKGTCGFLGFSKLESITHVGENLLDSLRAGRVKIDPKATTALLKLMNAIRSILSSIATEGDEGQQDFGELKQHLIELNSEDRKEEKLETKEKYEIVSSKNVEEDLCNHELIAELKAEIQGTLQLDQSSESHPNKGGTLETNIPKTNDNAASGWIEPSTSQPSSQGMENKPTPTPVTEERKESTLTDTSLRVDVNLLDHLMNLVSELVLARNQILQFTKIQSDSTLVNTSQRLNLITTELQEGVMKTRMQPIANVWNKFPRVVRDVARTCGKEIKLEMEGKETDLDKTIIEAIKDPLTHIVRNACDHGIEIPEKRIEAGKNKEGTLFLKAFHEGGNVIIEIRDDGAGINIDKLRSKIIEKGLASRDEISEMTDNQIAQYIFAPGLSTAETITNISGRGVGMDVVKSNIEKIGGSVDVITKMGKGTTIKIKIPLTLAIVPALIVSCDGQRFAIPQVSLVELVRIADEDINSKVEEIGGALFCRLRGNLLPLVYLKQELAMVGHGSVQEESNGINIVVVRVEDKIFGLVVDKVHDTEEIVVKPLGKQFKDIGVYAGATIMGDGRVALIVDISGLSRKAKIISENSDKQSKDSQTEDSTGEREDVRQSLLLIDLGEGNRGAIPLTLVNRLEEIPQNDLERAGGSSVVQYRGGILPLVDLREYFGCKKATQQALSVIVYSHGENLFGLVVDGILDTINESINLGSRSKKRGILGSAIVQEKVTDLLDLDTIVADATSIDLKNERESMEISQ